MACRFNIATDAAHVVPRRFRSVRWLIANGRALCRLCHRRYGENEAAWRRFVGPDYDELWVKAQERWDGSYERVLRDLRQAQEERAA